MGFCQYRISFIFLIIDTVACGNALPLYVPDSSVFLGLFCHSGVHKQMPSVGECNGTPRKTAVFIIRLVWRQGSGKIGPVQQVRADGMSPVHRSPMRIIRVILVKKMVLSVVEGKTVGVIHPAYTGGQVKFRPLFFFYMFFICLLIVSCLLQKRTYHDTPPEYD